MRLVIRHQASHSWYSLSLVFGAAAAVMEGCRATVARCWLALFIGQFEGIALYHVALATPQPRCHAIISAIAMPHYAIR